MNIPLDAVQNAPVHRFLLGLEDFLDRVGRAAEKDLIGQCRQELSQDKPCRVVVVGEFNSGKSTLINALVGFDILPTGIVPTTATVNILAHGEIPEIQVHSHGRMERIPFEKNSLQRYTAKHGDQDDIEYVQVFLPTIPPGLEITDTPGVNDINETRAAVAYRIIPSADAVVFLMDVQQPLKQSEIDFLKQRVLGQTLVKTFFVLNHRDRVTEQAEINDVDRYVRTNLRDIYRTIASELRHHGSREIPAELERMSSSIPVFYTSARRMLLSRQESRHLEGDPGGLCRTILGMGNAHARKNAVQKRVLARSGLILADSAKELQRRVRSLREGRDSLERNLEEERARLAEQVRQLRFLLEHSRHFESSLTGEIASRIRNVFERMASEAEVRLSASERTVAIRNMEQELSREVESVAEWVRGELAHHLQEAGIRIPAFPAKRQGEGLHLVLNGAEESGSDWTQALNAPITAWEVLLAVALAPALGILAAVVPFFARLFGQDSAPSSAVPVRQSLYSMSREIEANLVHRVREFLGRTRIAFPSMVNETQQRIRTTCSAILDKNGQEARRMEQLTSDYSRLESAFRSLAQF